MTFPALVFGILVAALIGCAFHVWRGGNLGKLILYLILSEVGFWTAQILGDQFGWRFWSVGVINLGMCVVGSAVFLGVGYWLSLVKPEENKPTKRIGVNKQFKEDN